MSARRVGPVVVLVLAGVALALVLVLRSDSGSNEEPLAEDTPEVAVESRLLPRSLNFGDTLTAVVDVTVDRRRVDPDSIRVQQEFSPWGLLGRPEQKREDSELTSFLRTTYVLRCVIGPCVPPRESYQLEFDPVVVSYRPLQGTMRHTVTTRWPVLVTLSLIHI